jgi:diguanylate cyclase (GGDEF)-like protein/PAS domain S-box-containing protein
MTSQRPGPGSHPPTIAVLSPVTGGFYFGGVLSGITREVAAAGGQVVLLQTLDAGRSGDEALGPPDFATPSAMDHVDGVIALAASVRRAFLEDLRALGKPVVLAGHQVESFDALSAMPDNAGGIRAVVEHLVRVHGHSRIGFVGSLEQTDMAERFAAYQDALRAHGLEPEPDHFFAADDNAESGGRAAARQIVAAGVPVTAVVVATDRNALGVLEELRDSADPAARALAIVGFDDIEPASTTRPCLTTVDQDFAGVGAAAARLLLAEVRGDPRTVRRQVSPSRLVVRTSCGCRPSKAEQLTVDLANGSLAEDRTAGNHSALERLDVRLHRILWPGRGGEELDDRSVRDLQFGAHAFERALDAAVAGDEETTARELDEAVARLHVVSTTPEALQRTVDTFGDHVEQLLGATALQLGETGRRRAGRFVRRATSALWLAHTAARMEQTERLEHTIVEQYALGMSLLDRRGVDPRSLGWLAATPVRFGCLALWDGTPGSSPLRIAGVYDPAGSLTGSQDLVGTVVPVNAFPSDQMLGLPDATTGEVAFVIPVRTDDTDWGVLAVVGWIDSRSMDARGSYNHWAALLAVAFEQERLLEQVRASEERYAVAARATDDGLWEWDLRTNTSFYSARCRQILGCPPDADGVHLLFDAVHPDDRDLARTVLSPDRACDTPVEVELRMRSTSGRYRWIHCRAIAVRSAGHSAHRIVGSLSDIDHRKSLEEQLRRNALHDALTGLPNRALLIEQLAGALDASPRPARALDDEGVTVLFIDLDGFKEVNDTRGHDAGDTLLVAVADRLRGAIRSDDTAARLGGDEFVVLLQTRSVPMVLGVVERIQRAIAEPVPLPGGPVNVTASVGIAMARPGRASGAAVLRDADEAMYRAKATRRGSWAFHQHEHRHAG